MNRYTEEMKLWLFDLAHGNLTHAQILSGFVQHYVLYDEPISSVQRDIAFHTQYSIDQTRCALDRLRIVLSDIASDTSKIMIV